MLAKVTREQSLPAAFHRVWTAAAVSGIGDGLRLTALPLLVAKISTDQTMVALVTVAGTLPWLLFGLLAGVVADRCDRRILMWTVDGTRAVLAVGFVALLASGVRSVPVILAFAFVMSSAHTVFMTASGALLPSIVPKPLLGAANGRLMGVQVLNTQLVGPGLAGVLFVAWAALPFAIDAVSFAASASLIVTLVLPRRAMSRAPEGRVWADLKEGVNWVFRHPVFRAQLFVLATINALTGVGLAVLVLYSRDVLRLGDIGYGLLVAMVAVGGIAGSALVSIARARLSTVRTMVLSVLAVALGFLLAGAAPSVPVVVVALVMLGAGGIAWNVITVSLRQEQVPDALIGRVTSCYRTFGAGATPLGAGIGAALVGHLPITDIYLVGSAVLVVVVAVCRHGLADTRQPAPVDAVDAV